jgi:rare lipoprotein A
MSLLQIIAIMLGILLTTVRASFAGSDTVTTSKVRPGETLVGEATVYPNTLNGHKTSSGATFHQTDHTAASNKLPLNARVKVTNLDNGKTTQVKITDRGRKLGAHKIDLSREAADEIGLTRTKGKVPVKIKVTSLRHGSTDSARSHE